MYECVFGFIEFESSFVRVFLRFRIGIFELYVNFNVFLVCIIVGFVCVEKI